MNRLREDYRVIKTCPTRSQRGLYESIDVFGNEGMREALLKPFTKLCGSLLSQGDETWHGRI